MGGTPFPSQVRFSQQQKDGNLWALLSMRIVEGIFDIAPREAAELGEQVKFLINPNFLWPQTSLTVSNSSRRHFFTKRTLA